MIDLIYFLVIGLVIGFLAGLIANAVTNRRSNSALMDVVLGVVGAFVGGWVLRAVGFYPYGFIGTLITATLGAIMIIWVVNLFTGNNRRIRF